MALASDPDEVEEPPVAEALLEDGLPVEEVVGVRVAMLIVVLRGTEVPLAIMVPLLPPTAGAVPMGTGI